MIGFSLALGFLLMALSVGALLFAVRSRRRLLRDIGVLDELVRHLAEAGEAGLAPALQTHGETLASLAHAIAALGRQLADARATETGRLETARRLAEAVLEAMPDPVLVVDGEARISRFNNAARQALGPGLQAGATAAELGNPVLRLAAEEASVGFPVASTEVPRVALAVDGAQRQFRVRALPLPAGAGAVLVLQDASEADAEADRLRLAAQGALVELRPLVDGLGMALLTSAGEGPRPGENEWRAIDRILRDLESAGTDRPLEPVDLMALTEEAVQAVALEAQRLRVKLQTTGELPAPRPTTDPIAAQRLLLRLLRQAVSSRAEGETVTVEVRGRPRPGVRIAPGLPEGARGSSIDLALLERARAALLHERNRKGGATVLHFSE